MPRVSNEEWHKRLPDLVPGQTVYKATQKVWFFCQEGHTFERTASERFSTFRHCGCPYCKGNQVYTRPLPTDPTRETLTALGVKPKYSFVVLAQI